MTKNQTVAAVSIGCFVVVAGALGWFLYDAIDARGEQEGELDRQMSSFRSYNDAPVFPSLKTIAMVNTNKADLVAWRNAARAYAARGDRKLAAETPPIFKQRLAKTVRRLCALPGGAAGHLAAPTFQFGFEAYLGDGGVLPDVKDVPRLAAQLDAITRVVAVLAKAGALEVKEVRRVDPPAAKEEKRTGRAGGRSSSRAAGSAASKGAGEGSAPVEPTCLEYAFSFTVRHDAFVKVLNALSSGERFFVVKNLAFKEVADDIETNIAAAESAKANAQNPRRRHRRSLIDAESAPASDAPAAKPITIVCDPETGSPIQVDMVLAEWRFESGEG